MYEVSAGGGIEETAEVTLHTHTHTEKLPFCQFSRPADCITQVGSTRRQANLSTFSITFLSIDRLIVLAPPCIKKSIITCKRAQFTL
uniref:Uncharacterized protein n=1 Tax=Timema genevievae TaxID=629358 RepID=A0A7R9JN20_TIMGE|nr:unnamed protein product [Timema genevievae]